MSSTLVMGAGADQATLPPCGGVSVARYRSPLRLMVRPTRRRYSQERDERHLPCAAGPG